jgi:hypothetical protein
MAYYADLSPVFEGKNQVPPLLAVGWLEKGQDFPTGVVDQAFFGKLVSLCNNPFEPWTCRGWHESSLRQFPHSIEQYKYSPHNGHSTTIEGLYWKNLYVPDGKRIFVCPLAILHYIDYYWYKPPDVFVAAVMSCPPIESMAYKQLVLASGGRDLLEKK